MYAEESQGWTSLREMRKTLTYQKPAKSVAVTYCTRQDFTRQICQTEREIYCKDLAYVTVDQLSGSKIHRADGRLEAADLMETSSSVFKAD